MCYLVHKISKNLKFNFNIRKFDRFISFQVCTRIEPDVTNFARLLHVDEVYVGSMKTFKNYYRQYFFQVDFKSKCSMTTFILKLLSKKILLNETIFLLIFVYNIIQCDINIDRLYSQSLDHRLNNKDLKKTRHVNDTLFPINNEENVERVCI